MLVEKLKQTAETVFDWKFDYGKDYWQNKGDYPDDSLLPFAERKKYLLLLWKDRDKIKNKHGATIGYRFTGSMLLTVRSRFNDPDYQYKYDTHIKNLEELADQLEDQFHECEDWCVKAWKEIEVENQFDTNMDGLKINFTIEYDG